MTPTDTKRTHTPGPWTIYKRHEGRGFYVREICGAPEAPGERGCLAEIRGVDSSVNDANARLIAAAPALLEACKAMLGIDNPGATAPGHIDYTKAVKMAHAAIAQTEGKGT